MGIDDSPAPHAPGSGYLPGSKGRIPLERSIAPQKNHGQVLHWNTRNLGLRLTSDAIAAASAGALVAPVISIIDRAIIENASGRNSLMSSVKAGLKQLLLRPHQFLMARPFRLIFTLYSGTYLTANCIDTANSTITANKPSKTTFGTSKFLATSAANMSMSFYKDAQFVRMFGPLNAVARPVPLPSYALFGLRDSLTVLASFNLPPLLAPRLPISETIERTAFTKTSAAQFLAPAAIQLLSTPLHLLGLDLYNRPAMAISTSERWQKIRAEWLKSSIARMCRIVPAFGAGGVVNMKTRKTLMGALDD